MGRDRNEARIQREIEDFEGGEETKLARVRIVKDPREIPGESFFKGPYRIFSKREYEHPRQEARNYVSGIGAGSMYFTLLMRKDDNGDSVYELYDVREGD